MPELPWIELARSFVGLEEIKGQRHNPTIIKWLDKMGSFQKEARAWWRDDETPWCGLFVGYIMGMSGRYVVKEWYRAIEWSRAGLTKLDGPAYGCIAVMPNHVGFVVGKDRNGNIILLGGNQGDAVRLSPFKPGSIVGYYWPSRWTGEQQQSRPLASRYDLPTLSGAGGFVGTQ